MRLVHTVPNVGVEASGPSNSVPALCAALARLGHDVRLHTVAPGPAAWPHAGVAHAAHPKSLLFRPLWGSAGLRHALGLEAGSADVVHTHGLWLLPNLYPARAVRGTRCRLVTSPRGTLSAVALQFSRRSKRVMWWLAQRAALEASDCLHATSAAELEEIRASGIRRPVAVIPNGVEIPAERPPDARSAGQPRKLLFLGRIHPKKGLGASSSPSSRTGSS
jgi:glycosyltransferase involved in cell wall biosynthesis